MGVDPEDRWCIVGGRRAAGSLGPKDEFVEILASLRDSSRSQGKIDELG